MINEEDYNLVEKYLASDLSKEDRTRFEERLEQEATLSETLLLVKSTNSLLGNRESINKTYAIIDKIDNDFRAAKKGRNIRRILFIAATFLILVVLAGSIYISTQSSSIKKIAQAHRPLPSMKGDNTSYYEARTAYNDEQNYEKALPLIEEVLLKNNDPNWLVAKGVSQMELEQFQVASTTFNDLISSHDLYASEGYWYLGLIEYKQDEKAKAKHFWEKIRDDSPYKKKGSQLLKKKIFNF